MNFDKLIFQEEQPSVGKQASKAGRVGGLAKRPSRRREKMKTQMECKCV